MLYPCTHSTLSYFCRALVALQARNNKRAPDSADNFIPNQPRVDPANSVVLEVANMTPYIDSALKALGLHTEARTTFITYVITHFAMTCRTQPFSVALLETFALNLIHIDHYSFAQILAPVFP
jgi:hypothetical protein